MKDIDTLTPRAIENIYRKIVETLSPEDWRRMRTPEYWQERDRMRSDITRKRVTIEFYQRYKRNGLRKE